VGTEKDWKNLKEGKDSPRNPEKSCLTNLGNPLDNHPVVGGGGGRRKLHRIEVALDTYISKSSGRGT